MQLQKQKPRVVLCAYHPQIDAPAAYLERVREITWYWTRQLSWQSDLTQIIHGSDVREILAQAHQTGGDYLLLVQDGQLIRSGDFVASCVESLKNTEAVALGHILAPEQGYPHLHWQCLFIDLKQVDLGRLIADSEGPAFGHPFQRSSENIHDEYTPLWIRRAEESASKIALENFAQVFLSGLLDYGLVANFSPELRARKIHFYPENNPALFWSCLQGESHYRTQKLDPTQEFYLNCHQLAQTRNKIFIFNTEYLRPPQTTPRPLAQLYSVAAGFRPYILLASNGFSAQTRVTYFDYAQNSLDLKEFLWRYWDGKDYFEGCHDFLAAKNLTAEVFHDVGDRSAWERRFEEAMAFFGGRQGWLDFWQRYQELEHDFLAVNLFESDEPLLAALRKGLARAPADQQWIWWSNCFYTEVGVVNYGSQKLKQVFETFFNHLKDISPDFYGDGGNHDQLTWVAQLKDMPFNR